jgi:drug/metabolite transporter (DMT)-like permease
VEVGDDLGDVAETTAQKATVAKLCARPGAQLTRRDLRLNGNLSVTISRPGDKDPRGYVIDPDGAVVETFLDAAEMGWPMTIAIVGAFTVLPVALLAASADVSLPIAALFVALSMVIPLVGAALAALLGERHSGAASVVAALSGADDDDDGDGD